MTIKARTIARERLDRLPKAFTIITPAIDGDVHNDTIRLLRHLTLQTLCHHAYTCLTPIINPLSRWFFSKFVEAMRMTLRSFRMQLSKKAAMLFFKIGRASC